MLSDIDQETNLKRSAWNLGNLVHEFKAQVKQFALLEIAKFGVSKCEGKLHNLHNLAPEHRSEVSGVAENFESH